MSDCDEVALQAKSWPRPITTYGHARGSDAARVDAAAVEVDLEEEAPGRSSRPAGRRRRADGRSPSASPETSERVAHALLPRLLGRAGAVEREADAAGVEDHVAGSRSCCGRVEVPGRRDRCLRVVLLAQVVPDAAALGRAEPDLERGQELRAARLVAAADAERAASTAAAATTSLRVHGG